jgi:glycerol-3-phosphate dehydrogenase
MRSHREATLDALAHSSPFDLLVIGGGATGLSVALDAATRGLRVALLEGRDFAEGTSSKATKLLHGGVRYLAQGNLALVRQALQERTILMRNAPHLTQPLPFLIPVRSWAQRAFYEAGLRVYDRLAGAHSLGPTRWIGAAQARQCAPRLNAQNLLGAVVYMDGQFDDARLAIALARTAQAHGAILLNHVEVTGLLDDGGRIQGVQARDRITGGGLEIQARCVVNATGVWVDDILRLRPEAGDHPPHVQPSQGIHLALQADWLDGRHAVLVPRTTDGRVLFAVPWLGHTVLGTTDTPVKARQTEPEPQFAEVEFLLGEASRLFDRPVQRQDVRSIWAGLRPLVRPSSASRARSTRAISREHSIWVDHSGLVSVTGGKWTTCRAMAEDVLDACADAGLLPAHGPCRTRDLPLHDGQGPSESLSAPLSAPLSKAPNQPPGEPLPQGLTEAMVRHAAREEWAVRVADVLARRSRLLFLDAEAAGRAAPAVARILRQETGVDPDLSGFEHLVRLYRTLPEPL